ncbi:PREDICTED: aspartyl protease family protein 2 [Tarenaya hassleriana]|uniref:aspartyl protease family protein 2 n=1 Tax=Tarenaya hassleriana TaxID=28532 RepID=UPI00053CA868|nr:PREDICTED: aspartyl protease family protein 2 [Tarenaya hassleriana]
MTPPVSHTSSVPFLYSPPRHSSSSSMEHECTFPMERNFRNALVFSIAILLCSFTSHSSTLRHQTLVVNPLPTSPTLSWPDSEFVTDGSDSLSETATSLSAQLLHVDALSPSDTSPEHLFDLRLRRDSLRVETLTSFAAASVRNVTHAPRAAGGFSGAVVSGLSQGSGEYFTRLGVGTPATYAYMVLDTGSDIVWLQCSPCKVCYNQSDPIFDPAKSRSYATVPCASRLCRRLDSPGCNSRRMCLYQVSYGDGSFTVGDLSTETLSFRGARVDHVAVGCGHDNEGLFVGAAGLLGLGRGGLSFPSQTKNRFKGKFSYCLVDRTSSAKPSTIVFGDGAAVNTAVYTPLLTSPKLDTFYYLELLGISVGGTRVRGVTASLFKTAPAGNGGVIIDSGTSVTRLTRAAYVALRDAFRAGASRLKRAPAYSLFDTCFDLSGMTTVKVPTVVFHFSGGDVSLPATNYLIPVDSKGRFCFAFAGTMGGLSIFGNIQQQSFRVVYDLIGSRVGFAPRGC